MIKIGIIGDFDPGRPSHKATNDALSHCADYLGTDLEIRWLPTEDLENSTEDGLKSFDGLWCAPGSPYRSMKGAINAIRLAREGDYPFIGTCGGFQHAVIEYAWNKLGLSDAKHAEFDPDAPDLIITPLSCSLVGETRRIFIDKNSMVYGLYRQSEADERFSCNFGINPGYRKLIDESGFKVAGTDENGEARILELRQNRFYVATLFQPQLSSLPEEPHKLILAYLSACVAFASFKKGRQT